MQFFKKYKNNDFLLKLNELYNNFIIYNAINKENVLEKIKPLKIKKMDSYTIINSKPSTNPSLTSINVIDNKLPILNRRNSNSNIIIKNNTNI